MQQKFFRGLSWSALERLLNRGAQFIFLIIAARFLIPEDFAVMAIITVFITICNSVIEFGFNSALIRLKKISKKDYDTAFTFSCASSVIFIILLFLLSGPIGTFFEMEILKEILKLLPLNFLLFSAIIIYRVKFERELNFKTISYVTFPSSILSIIVATYFLTIEFGIWSLIIQIFTLNISCLLLFIMFSKTHPALKFNNSSFQYLFKFGKPLFLVSLIDSIARNGVFFIIGKFQDPFQTGLFFQARNLSNYPSSNFSQIIQKFSLPYLSKVQDNISSYNREFMRILRISVIVSFGYTSLIYLEAENIIHLLLGEKWLDSVIYFKLLLISWAFLPIHALNLNSLKIMNLTQKILNLELKKIPLYLSTFISAIYFDLYVVSIVFILSQIILYFINALAAKDARVEFLPQLKFILKLLLYVSGSVVISKLLSFCLNIDVSIYESLIFVIIYSAIIFTDIAYNQESYLKN